jgi:hypothetical protein
MPSKKHKPEEIIGELREVEIMLGQGGATAELRIPRFIIQLEGELPVFIRPLGDRGSSIFEWRQPAKRCVRTALVILAPPSVDLRPGVRQRQEPVSIKSLVARAAVERLESVGLPGREKSRLSSRVP